MDFADNSLHSAVADTLAADTQVAAEPYLQSSPEAVLNKPDSTVPAVESFFLSHS